MSDNSTAVSCVIPFSFDGREVRTLLIEDQPWFVANDVSAALLYSEASAMTRHLDEDEKGLSIVQTLGGDQEMLVINESGLYSAILRSRKAEAKRFKKWVTSEVLPAIRKTGRYEDPQGRLATLIGQTIGTDGFHMLGAIVKGKVASLPAPVQRRATAKIWSQVHAAFGVRSAADIPAEQLDGARNFIAAYNILEGEYLPVQNSFSLSIDRSQALQVDLVASSAAWVIHYWNSGIGEAVRYLNPGMFGACNEHLRNAQRVLRVIDESLIPELRKKLRPTLSADHNWGMRPDGSRISA